MLIISIYDLVYYITIYCIFILLIFHFLFNDIFRIKTFKQLFTSCLCAIIPLINILFLILLIITLFINKNDTRIRNTRY